MHLMYSLLVYWLVSFLWLWWNSFLWYSNENILTDEQEIMATDWDNLDKEEWKIASIKRWNMIYEDFIVDNTLELENTTLHFSSKFPTDFDSDKEYNLYIALPWWEWLYFQWLWTNIKYEKYAFEAQKYKDDLIVISPQLDDWWGKSANDVITLVEYIKNHYNISKIYISWVSWWGETLSIVLGKRPELFTSALFISSQWNWNHETLVKNKIPLYMVIWENDSYYGSKKTKDAYKKLYALYKEQGLTDDAINEILILDVKPHEYFTQKWFSDEHAWCVSFAYEEDIMSRFFNK